MSEKAIRRGSFWRYNFRVLMGTGYWVLVVPVAVSQVVTLWMFALSADFGQMHATRIAELMTPIISAFLVAHSLAPEYRSGVGAVLACKPVSLGRVLFMRALLGMLAGVTLTAITLSVCSVGLKPIDVGTPLLACLPGVFFYSGLALVFATIFRNPLAGFCVPLGIWALDFGLGYGVQPLFSAQGMTATIDRDALAVFAPASKALQLVVGLVLFSLHGRLLQRVCRPPERADVMRIAICCIVVILAYCATGMGTMLGYAYNQRGRLPNADVQWIRLRLAAYGPLPVAQLFGPAFVTYVSEPPPPVVGKEGLDVRKDRLGRLEDALKKWPTSMWADSIAFALAMETRPFDVQQSLQRYQEVVDKFPQSPFAPKALANIMHDDDRSVSEDDRLKAARRLLTAYPEVRDTDRAADTLDRNFPEKVTDRELLTAAKTASAAAPEFRRPFWLMRMGELQLQQGNKAEAGKNAVEALTRIQKMQATSRTDTPEAMELRPHMADAGRWAQRAQAVIDKSKGCWVLGVGCWVSALCT